MFDIDRKSGTFVECSTTKVVSAHIGDWVKWWPKNALTDYSPWLRSTSVTGKAIDIKVHMAIVAAFFWVIWALRNSRIFNGTLKKE